VRLKVDPLSVSHHLILITRDTGHWSLITGHWSLFVKDRGGIDSQFYSTRQWRKAGIAAIKFQVRMSVRRYRAAMAANVSNANAFAFIAELEVCDVKNSERDICKIA
jgi:hypothetical protein